MKTTRLSLFLLTLCLSFISQNTFGQNQLSGKVTDQNGEGIFFATIGLYEIQDSLLAKAISTEDDGSFQIKNIKDGQYYLVASMLGYQQYQIENIKFPGYPNAPLKISLSENSEILESVEIKARVPLLEQRSDRLVVNVANNVTSLNNSLLDVMKQVPGIIVTGDKIRMAGQTNMTILINGKTTRYMDMETLLRDMPGDNIEKVEVIHQPGAEFEASGTGPIINIILKKNSLYGTNGSASVGVGKGRDWKYRSALNLSHYQGPVNIQGGVGFRHNPYYEQLDIQRSVNGDYYDQVSQDPQFSQTFRSNLGVDWDITKRHRIGVSSQYRRNNRDNQLTNTTSIDFGDPAINDISFVSINNENSNWNLFSVNPYYTFEIDTMGQKLAVDFDFATFRRLGTNTLTNDSEIYPGQEFSRNGNTNIYGAKIDYTYPLNKNITFSTGAQYNLADLDNDFKAFDQEEDGFFALNSNESNQFLFSEQIIAAYVKSTWSYKKWKGTIGLRYEDSESIGRSVQVDTTLRRDIEQFFPSFSISREIKGPLAASFAYSYRIDRPRYNSLNPFRFYLDPFTFDRGNPSLQPAFTHSGKLNLSYDNQPFFNVEYKDTRDAMVQVLEQNDETGTTNQVILNLESFKTFNTSLFFPLDFIPKISGYGGAILNYSFFDSAINDVDILRNRWTVTTFLQTNFTLPYDINTEITGWYNSGELDGVITGEYLYGVDIGFSKKILNNKGRLSFGVDNLFWRPFHGNVQYSTVDLSVISRWDAPVANFQFSYKFGNPSLKKKEKAGGSGSDMLRRASN